MSRSKLQLRSQGKNKWLQSRCWSLVKMIRLRKPLPNTLRFLQLASLPKFFFSSGIFHLFKDLKPFPVRSLKEDLLIDTTFDPS